MSSVIVVLIVLALMGSVFWIMPSAADRKRMHLRQKAMRVGLRIRIPDKGFKERLVRYEEILLGGVLYERPYSNGRKSVLTESFYIIRGEADGEWTFIESRLPLALQRVQNPLLGSLKELPAGIKLVVISPHGISLLWNESGTESDVDVLLDVVNELSEMLQA